MAEGFYNPNDVIMGYNHLLEKHKKAQKTDDEDEATQKARPKALAELVRCDFSKLEKAKEYNGARFFPNVEVYLGTTNGGQIEYAYKEIKGLKFARVVASMGAMAHDHPKREGFGVSFGFSTKATSKVGQRLGEALRLLTEAGEILLNNSIEHVKKFKPKANTNISVPFKTVAKDGKPVSDPCTNVKIRFKKSNPKGAVVELTDKPEIPIKDVTKKNEKGNDFLPLTVNGSPLNYSNSHKVLTRGSELSGSISYSACQSGLGLSIIFNFNTLVVKSAGENDVSAASVLGEDYSALLSEADSYGDGETEKVEVTTTTDAAKTEKKAEEAQSVDVIPDDDYL